MSPLVAQPAICTADIYDRHHETVDVINLQFRCFGRHETFFGPCATLRVFEDHVPVRDMLATPGEGRILVVDGHGSLRIGVMGDRLAAAGTANGWRGVIIHGAIRDSIGIDALDIGVRALGTTARRGWDRAPTTRGEALFLGGAAIAEGDWLYADRDAVIVSRGKLSLDDIPAQPIA